MELSYNEIESWEKFEDLVASYFREIKIENNIIDIKVKPSGTGTDGGRDILVTFRIADSLVSFKRKWIVQCKFYNRNLRKSDLSDINIPTLIHEYGAVGYLLICKERVTSGVSKMFENLGENCKFKYHYEFWHGSHFLDKIVTMNKLLQSYFPKYHEYTEEREKKL